MASTDLSYSNKSLYISTTTLFLIFAVLLFILLTFVYVLFGPLPSQTKFVEKNGGIPLEYGDKNNSIVIGVEAGKRLTTGTNNVLIGERAGSNLTIGRNNIMLGANSGNLLGGSGLNDTFYVNPNMTPYDAPSVTNDEVYLLAYNHATGQIYPIKSGKVKYVPTV